MTIKNPVEWSFAQLNHAAQVLGHAGDRLHHIQDTIHSPAPAIRRIRLSDVTDAISKGLDDFGAARTDIVFLCLIYPAVGVVLAALAFGHAMLPLVFPLASGFALLGPLAAVGLYEISRQREAGKPLGPFTAFEVRKSPAAGAIVILGLLLTAIFIAWLAVAWAIYMVTLGPAMPASIGAFAHDVLQTDAGHRMIVLGMSVGFLFALLAMAISVVSFPLLLDKDVGLDTAIGTSIRAVQANPGPMALWGLIVAGALALGSIPLFVGLIVVMPVLGHATWHLYRKMVAR